MLLTNYKIVIFVSILILKDVTPSKPMFIAHNSEQKQALDKYFTQLERIVRFGIKYSDLIDMNFYFGLFLVNVNLENVLKDKRSIPSDVQMKMLAIVKNNKKLLQLFQKQSGEEEDLEINKKRNMKIFSLISKVSRWVDRLPAYPAVLKRYVQTPADLKRRYGDWKEYQCNVNALGTFTPTPQLSEMCLGQLSSSVRITSKSPKPTCKLIAANCFNMLVNGTDFGYFLSHRLLYMIMARFGRGCTILPAMVARKLAYKLCASTFSEAEYIAMHDYQAVDLMTEQISLCAMAGFISPKIGEWMGKIAEFQTPFGCVGSKRVMNHSMPYEKLNKLNITTKMWILSKKYYENDIMGGICNSHTTATTAAAIAVAIRTILMTE